MKRLILCCAALVSLMALATPNVQAETCKTAAKKHAKKAETPCDQDLREMLQKQQAEIDELKAKLASLTPAAPAAPASTVSQADVDAAKQQAEAANATAAAASAKVDAMSSSVNDLKTTTTGLSETVVSSQKRIEDEIESPMALHYKGVTIMPVAFFAMEGVWRERSINSDINTPFNSIPVPGAIEGHVGELNFSGRQSRVGLLVEGKASNFKLSGYFEGDFLSSGTTSNNNQSNSYTLRQRQFWGKAETNSGFAVTGGQMWSLVTEDGKSTDARTEKLPNTIDPQYMVGFSWTRQPGIRLQQRFGDVKTGALTLALSAEQAQITSFTVAGAAPANYFFAGAGTGGGLYNAYSGNYANNIAPDVIVKAAYDLPKAHFELGGLARFMRDNYYPILTETGTTASTTYTYATYFHGDTKAAGGVFGSVRVSPSKYVDLALQAMAGEGVGRYGSSQLADATLRPDGTLEPVRNYHGLFSLETHPMPKLDVFGYYGGEYAQRTVYASATGALLGYGLPNANDAGCYALPANPGGANNGTPGNPSTCTSPTRYIQEGMLGFTYRIANSPKYGRLQYSLTYQFLQRNLWSGVTSGTYGAAGATYLGPRAQDNMIHAGMRYYIP